MIEAPSNVAVNRQTKGPQEAVVFFSSRGSLIKASNMVTVAFAGVGKYLKVNLMSGS